MIRIDLGHVNGSKADWDDPSLKHCVIQHSGQSEECESGKLHCMEQVSINQGD